MGSTPCFFPLPVAVALLEHLSFELSDILYGRFESAWLQEFMEVQERQVSKWICMVQTLPIFRNFLVKSRKKLVLETKDKANALKQHESQVTQ